MLKIENKFIYFVLILIFIIVCFIVYIWFFKSTVDRNSYVSLIEWKALLNEKDIFIWEKIKLKIGDLIKTTKEESLAIIEWWDWSITRLWWNTSVVIDDLYVSELKDNIKISFNLLSWKSWSNVISFLPWDSYFRQSFMDYEAAVRWTIFNVDLDNDYIYVVSHKVFLTSSEWEKIEVSEQKPFKLSSFEFIRLDEFIRKFKDNIFEDLNRKLDNEFLNLLKNDLISKIDNLKNLSYINVDNLSLDKQKELYENLLSSYQDLNFIDSKDWELFDLKISIKEKLLSVAPEVEKENILNSFVYDFKDSLKSSSYESMNNILTIFSDNTDYISFREDIFLQVENIKFTTINQSLAESILNNLDNLNNSFSIWTITNSLENIRNSFDNAFKNSINNLFGN